MSRRKRPRVRLRPKVRSRRRSFVRTALTASLFAVAVTALVWTRPWRAWDGFGLEGVPGADLARVRSLRIVGVPDALAVRMLDRIEWRPGDFWGPRRPAVQARGLMRMFSCLKTVRARRSWTRRAVVFEAKVREPVATVAGKTDGRFLDAAGKVFEDPVQIVSRDGLPEVELEGIPESFDLGPVAGLIRAGNAPGALPAPWVGFRFVSEKAGWEGFLADGTFLEWGPVEWTGLKLRRLRQVLDDAGPRLEGTLTADLKHFEDGKILIRPR
ncbi:MAG: hypothetical protein COR54_04830 [Elusimicrobia bacterium CG22_combo_CG10-13_8_21_14_all_63_91]|nr:MAG: hypothetical protein COR54_04830 [Elusimicrobia bacterium CG22_combo_CG10-13_8_21_14_all_63_91]